MKYSTGRKTRLKYSTAMSWDEYEKKIRRSRVKYSTGKGAAARHSCGIIPDDDGLLNQNDSSGREVDPEE